MVKFNDVSLDTTDYLSEQDYDRKKAGIVSQLKNVPITVEYRKGVNICWKTKKGFTIEKSKPKLKGIDGNTAINHELAHVLFDSFDDRAMKTLERWSLKWSDNGKKDTNYETAYKVYQEAMNVIEDQRIESLWGRIYLGNVKDFVKVRKNLGKELDYIDHPSLVLLAERFFRTDFVKKSKYGFLSKYLHDVEHKDIKATMVVLRRIKPYLDEKIDELLKKIKQRNEAMEKCKVMNNEYLNDRNSSAEQRAEKLKNHAEAKEAVYQTDKEIRKETFREVNRNDNFLSEDGHGTARDAGRLMNVNEYTDLELGNNPDDIDGSYESTLTEEKDRANAKVSEIREDMQGSDAMPVAPVFVKEKPIKHDNTARAPMVDQRVVKEISHILRMFKEKTKQQLSEEGSEIDIEGYINMKANGYGESFVRDVADNGLSICLSVDASGSMGRHNDIVKQLVATLWEATKGTNNIDIKCITWSSDRKGNMRIQRYNNMEDIKYLDKQDGGYTPTHFGIEMGSQELSKMKGRRKLLIVITDGFPNYKKNGVRIRRDVTAKETIKSYKKSLKVTPNIAVVGVGAVYGDWTMQEMFKRYTRCRTMGDVSKYVTGTLKKEIVRVMKR